jgi:hypothetical protein
VFHSLFAPVSTRFVVGAGYMNVSLLRFVDAVLLHRLLTTGRDVRPVEIEKFEIALYQPLAVC